MGTGIPPAGLLTAVLLNFALTDFDTEFVNLFPGLPDIKNEAYVSECSNNKQLFDERETANFLGKLRLNALVMPIERGEEPVPCFCFSGQRSINHNGIIQLREQEE